MSNLGPNADTAEWLLQTVRKNPEGLLLLGAGLALLMRSGGQRAQQQRAGASPSRNGATGGEGPYGPYGMDGTSGSGERMANQARGTAEQLRNSVNDATETVSRSYDQMQSQVQDTANAAMQSGQRAVNSALESGQKAMNSAMQSGQQVVTSIAAQPFLVALMGLGTGLAVASLLPETEIEHRAFQDAGKNLADRARDAGDRIASATGEVGDKLAEAAAERGLNKEGVQELAGELTDTFKNALSDKKEADGEQDKSHEPAQQGSQVQ
ncbi:MAG TPA: hypothetical protein VHY80_15645 [Stellaceae bacterium]|nr:hypothetical protein [Stellaceae bacterium]